LERDSIGVRAEHEAQVRSIAIHQSNDPAYQDLLQWSPERAWDRSNFDYLFLHRQQFARKYGKIIREHLEIVSAKVHHVSADGQDGYFKQLERNVGWLDYLVPIIFSRSKYADRIVRCGLWINARNS